MINCLIRSDSISGVFSKASEANRGKAEAAGKVWPPLCLGSAEVWWFALRRLSVRPLSFGRQILP